MINTALAATAVPATAVTATTAASTAGNQAAASIADGSLLVALPIAALAGLISFLSPCVLPLLPGYMGYVTGLTGMELNQHKRGRVFAGIGLFVLGFSVVFVLIGAVFTRAYIWMMHEGQWVTQALGVIVALLGVVFMGGFGFMQRERRITKRPPAGLWGAPLLGMTFALGWAPCMGPSPDNRTQRERPARRADHIHVLPRARHPVPARCARPHQSHPCGVLLPQTPTRRDAYRRRDSDTPRDSDGLRLVEHVDYRTAKLVR